MNTINHAHNSPAPTQRTPSFAESDERDFGSFVPLVAPLLAVVVLTLAALASGTARAQGDWAGLRSGYPFGVAAHYGIGDGLAEGTDLRVTARAYVNGGSASFGVGLDGLRTVVTEAPFYVYLGAGPALGVRDSGAFFLNVHGLVGGEFRFSDVDLPQLGVFVEAAAGATLRSDGPSTFPDVDASVGFNWHF